MVSTYSAPKKRGTVTPWSYSSLSAYETCPWRFYLTRISKQVSEPQTEATIHGNEVHKALEKAVAGTQALPEKYAGYQPIVERIRAAPGKKLVEFKFGLTKALKPTEFFGADVWVRGVIDLAVVRPTVAVVTDYKTGKRKLDGDQTRLFAMAGLSLWPFVNRVDTSYIWLQTSKLDREVFTRDQQIPIYQEFAARVHRMETSQQKEDWPKRPSGLCKAWCPVGKALCEHCGK